MTRATFGSRAQVAALIRSLDDALGNKDGIPGNEAPGARSRLSDRQPLLNRVRSSFEPGLTKRDETKRLSNFLSSQEARWGRAVTDLPAHAVPDMDRFRAEKAISLVRFGRSPSEVTEGFVHASGRVDRQFIAPREVFWQRWKPMGQPSGTVVVIPPGFLQTGRSFHEQIQLLNRAGHDVVVMDQQWAGHTEGKRGGIDRGFGIARDVAAVTAHASALAERDYDGVPHRVVLAGTSMGAGAGALMAITLNDAGKVDLDGAQMPRGVGAVLQAPYFAKTPSMTNRLLAAAGKVRGLKHLPLPAFGLPALTYDPDSRVKFAEHATGESLVARGQAFNASDEDLGVLRDYLDGGMRPEGRVFFIHAERDPLALYSESKAVAEQLGPQARLLTLTSRNHIFEENAEEQHHILEGIRWVTGDDQAS